MVSLVGSGGGLLRLIFMLSRLTAFCLSDRIPLFIGRIAVLRSNVSAIPSALARSGLTSGGFSDSSFAFTRSGLTIGEMKVFITCRENDIMCTECASMFHYISLPFASTMHSGNLGNNGSEVIHYLSELFVDEASAGRLR